MKLCLVLQKRLALGALAAGFLLAPLPADARNLRGNMSESAWATIESKVRAWYGPESEIFYVYPYEAPASPDPAQVEEAGRDLGILYPEEEALWFGPAPAITRMNALTGHRGVLAPSPDLGGGPSTVYLVMVRRAPGIPTRLGMNAEPTPARAPAAAAVPTEPKPTTPKPTTPKPTTTKPTATKPSEGADSDIHLGPLLGAMYLSVDGNEFVSPMIGGSIRRDRFTAFLGGGGLFPEDGEDDRFYLGGLRYGPSLGPFVELVVVDARQVAVERGAWTHRATGATGGIGYREGEGHFQWSVGAGAGAFKLVTPKQIDSETSFGFSLAGQAGFIF
jgi:cell division septation protein DedD